jgi:Na+:H+ antiporter, NhaA family
VILPVLLGRGKGGVYKFTMMTRFGRFTLEFLKTEAGSGFILAAAALVALVWANSPWAATYFGFVHYHFPIQVGAWRFDESVLEWTKEGLMAVFFFLVGLEIKYEILRGELSSPQKLALPVVAALGGMIVPAIVYLLVNLGGDLRGWSVPVATDIAFALAVLAMVGKGLPTSLRVFLLTLAIVDDLGAVLIIGIFYSSKFDPMWIGVLAGIFAAMASLRYLVPMTRMGFSLAYGLLSVVAWFVTMKAGISPSLTAVACAFCVTIDGPNRPGWKADDEGVLKPLAHELHPYVAYLILPFFAFVASGFSLSGMGLDSLHDPRFLGIAAGLLIGKPAGIFAACYLAVAMKLAKKPDNATEGELFGVCLLCGIGFTMSLYIGALAFPAGDAAAQNAVKSGVVVGSILSACAGAIWLKMRKPAVTA